ncbi:MAG: CaiB/BaiF CoA transferase family protein [Acidimicrobiales bacterium]
MGDQATDSGPPGPPGPFAGLRVIEFGRFIAVPYCGQLLADGGAEVIKVEPLGGDPSRGNGILPTGDSRQFVNKNRGKRSVALDLSMPAVADVVAGLVGGADVILANFRPGVAERLGVDHASVAAINPRVIYAVNTAYGDNGPRGGAVGMDVAVQAYSGLCQMGHLGPMPQPEPLIDYTAAMLLAFGVATALYHRERTGIGQRLDVSLLQASLLLQNNHVGDLGVADDWRRRLVKWLDEAFRTGTSWAEIVEHWQHAAQEGGAGGDQGSVYYGIVRAADGYLAIGGGGIDLRARIAAILAEDGVVGSRPGSPGHEAEARAALARRPVEEWLARLGAQGVPAAPLRFREQMVDDEQAWANGYLVRLPHPRLGEITTVGPPLRLSSSPMRATTPPPDIGQDTRVVLADLGLDEARIDALARSGAVGLGPSA